jgi:hypothetical protein
VAAATTAAVTGPPAAASRASAPSVLHPVEPVTTPAKTPDDVTQVLAELFGRGAVASLFRTDDFVRRFVATVDNLGREQAPAGLWPLEPARGAFLTAHDAAGAVIAADNGLRYARYVVLLEQVDLRQAAESYRQFYPLFQRTYEELGFPGRYFNDRFVAVLDLLLATPEPASPPRMHLPDFRAASAPSRPWVLYEFDDAHLQSLPAGQRMLLRMGLANERRVKRRLAELRALVAGG